MHVKIAIDRVVCDKYMLFCDKLLRFSLIMAFTVSDTSSKEAAHSHRDDYHLFLLQEKGTIY